MIARYARAIETKDLAMFRSVKPNLTGEEERRLREGFRAVGSQQVEVTIVGIDRRASRAVVRLHRRDTITSGSRTQTTESNQVLTMIPAGDGWVIERIGQ